MPGSQQYPQRLENLLADNRFPNVRRHLRRIYRDPMTGSTDWGLVRGPNGGIVGVYSTSTAQPLKTANFPKDYAAFAGAPSYRDWVFAPGGGAAGAPAGATPGGSSLDHDSVRSGRAERNRSGPAGASGARPARALGVQRAARERSAQLRR